MKIYFKWPNSNQGKQFYLKTDTLRGAQILTVDDVPATKVEANVFQYFDKDLNRERKVEVINRVFDNPAVEIDGKDINLFDKTSGVVRALTLLPCVLAILFTGNIEGDSLQVANNWIRVGFAVLGIIVNILLGRKIKGEAVRVLLYVIVTVLAFFGTIGVLQLIH